MVLEELYESLYRLLLTRMSGTGLLPEYRHRRLTNHWQLFEDLLLSHEQLWQEFFYNDQGRR